MKMKKCVNSFLIASVLCIGLILCIPQTAYGEGYTAGQSMVAADQEEASKGLSFPGLDITWLDLGEDYIRYFSTMPNQFSEGIFTLPISSEMVTFDTSGKILSAGYYDEVDRFSDGMALVQKYLPRETEWRPGQLSAPPEYESGYIDLTGKEVIPLGKFHGLEADFHEGLAVLGGYTSENKGFINKAGEIAIPQIYLNAGDFSEGLAPVQSTETKLWGYIDSTGVLVVPMEYEKAEPFHDRVAYVIKNGLAGYIDNTGKTVIDFQFKTNEFDRDRSFYNELAVALDDSGKYGYIGKSGEFVIPAQYLRAEPFTGDVAVVTCENPTYINGYGSSFLINRQGERLTPLWCYSSFSGEPMEDGLFRVLHPYGTDPNQSIAMLNRYGAEVIPASLHIENISPFNEGVALLIGSNKDGKLAVGLVKTPENIEEKKSGRLIKVLIDGKRLDFTDTDPVIENSKALVPMKAIFEALGAEVNWDAENYVATGTKDGIRVALKIGDNKGYINDETVELDAPARIQNARTLVPIRFVAESFHAEVSWNGETRTVSINTK